MFDDTQMVEMTWCAKIKKRYIELGYNFTAIGDIFYVNAKDLSHSSEKYVTVICDYCGKAYQQQYKHQYNHEGKDCCKDCWNIKFQETMKEKYGEAHALNIKKFKEKIQETNMEKFGKPWYTDTEQFKIQQKQTFLENYGVENPLSCPIIFAKSKQTLVQHYGVKNPSQSSEIKEKIRKNFYKNKTYKSSIPETKMCEIISSIYGTENCEQGYPYYSLNFDCMLKIKNKIIDIEYDGWYWHKNRVKEDRRRNYFLRNRGIAVIRFRANTVIPTEQDIQEAVDYIVKGNHSLYIKDLEKLDI